MASTIQYSLIRRPELLDVVDEEWEKEVLPVDGAFFKLCAYDACSMPARPST